MTNSTLTRKYCCKHAYLILFRRTSREGFFQNGFTGEDKNISTRLLVHFTSTTASPMKPKNTFTRLDQVYFHFNFQNRFTPVSRFEQKQLKSKQIKFLSTFYFWEMLVYIRRLVDRSPPQEIKKNEPILIPHLPRSRLVAALKFLKWNFCTFKVLNID